MSRIVSYPYDNDIKDADAWIGSEAATTRTKQYTAEAVANYLNINGKISIGGQMAYEYVANSLDGVGTFSLFGGGISPVAFSAVTKLTYSNIDKGGQRVVEFLNLLIGSDILIAEQKEISTFGYYTLNSYVVNAGNSDYYDLSVTFKDGNGAMAFKKIYDIQNFVLANDATQSPWELVAEGINYPVGNVGIGITTSEDYLNVEKTNLTNDITRGVRIKLTKDNATGTDFVARGYALTSTVENTSSGNVSFVQGSTSSAIHSGTGDMSILAGQVGRATHEGSGVVSGVYGGYSSGKASGTGVAIIDFIIGDVIVAELNNPNASVRKYHGINNTLKFTTGTVTEEAVVTTLDIDSSATAIINGDFSYLKINRNTAYPTISGSARSIYSDSVLPSTFTGSVSIGKSTLPTSSLEVTGNVKFDSYGIGNITGTPTQRLGVDSTGNVIEIPIGSGAVDGSGTTNFITKWIDTDTIGDSVMFDNGTNVGIGTTSPTQAKLVVNTTSLVASAFGRDGTDGDVVQIYNGLAGSTKVIALGTIGNDGTIYSQYGDLLLQPTAGNVGIGTTSPSQKLHVNAGTTNTVALFESTDATSRIVLKDNSGEGHVAAIGDNITFATSSSGSERMRITSTGNVGIGTTSPGAKLDVSDSIPVLRITGTRNASWTIGQTMASLEYFSEDASGSSANSVRASINLVNETSVYGSTTGLSFSTKGDVAGSPIEAMRINSSGNVGIGTTSPTKNLEVSAATDTTISIASSDTSINVGQNIGILEFASNNETSLSQAYTAFSKIKTISESAVSGTGSVNGAITFETASANVISERMRIDSSGAIKFNAYDSTNQTGTPTYVLGTDASGNVVKVLGGDIPGGGGTVTGTGAATQVAFWDGTSSLSGSNGLYWDNTNGHLGIGDTTPNAKLRVVTTNSETSINTVDILHSRNNPDVATNAVRIDMNLSGADNTTADRINSGLFLDIDSSADGDASNEHRIYGVYSDVRFSGFSDLVRAGYFLAESNNITEKTGQLVGVFGNAVHDASSTSGGVTNMYGAYGISSIQDLGDVDNAFGGFFLTQVSSARGNANVGVTKGVEGRVSIDKATTISYGEMTAVSGVIDNNEGTLPTFGNQYLFKGDYQGTKGGSAYGIYTEGDKHYFEGDVGIGTTSPTRALEVVKTDASNILGVFDSNSSINTQIAFSDANSTAGQYSTRIGSIGDGLGFWTNGSNQRMCIDSAGNVGIGTTSPSEILHISGTGEKFLKIASTDQAAGIKISSDGTGEWKVYQRNSFDGLEFEYGGTSAMTFLANRNVGIGTISPASRLDVSGGDVEVKDIASGVIMKSPDGTRYRVTVANGGTLSVAAV